MRKEILFTGPRSKALLSGAILGLAIFGSDILQAQEPRPLSAIAAATQSENAERGVSQSDIRRSRTVGDVDGDGYGDASTARQADLKKLADELVNVQQPPADTNSQGEPAGATNADSGDDMDAEAMNRRAGDPIPGIDITVNQGRDAASDKSRDDTESVPALDPNPYH